MCKNFCGRSSLKPSAYSSAALFSNCFRLSGSIGEPWVLSRISLLYVPHLCFSKVHVGGKISGPKCRGRRNTICYIFLYVLIIQSYPTLCDSLVCPWKSPGKNIGVGCHSLSLISTLSSHGAVWWKCNQIHFTVSSDPTPVDADTAWKEVRMMEHVAWLDQMWSICTGICWAEILQPLSHFHLLVHPRSECPSAESWGLWIPQLVCVCSHSFQEVWTTCLWPFLSRCARQPFLLCNSLSVRKRIHSLKIRQKCGWEFFNCGVSLNKL